MKIIELEVTDSTNEYCKRIANGEDVIVTAKRQTSGKGTKGRSFVSDGGGLYISVMRHNPVQSGCAFKIMVDSCTAVCKTLQSFNLTPVIRWSNDVLVNGKKICGTLIENTFRGDTVSRSIVGMGINVNNVLPQDLQEIATTMQEAAGKDFDVSAVRDALVKNLQKSYSLKQYKSYINWFGREILLRCADGEIRAVAQDVAEDGRLVCTIDGKTVKVSSAEVSLRL
ncbi:MAG: biotin--[acetyl-CoA-carboxylase] ligase [Clostridia bacterium]|nr:biotin--[acetyl-CoA-carboxylase] ligase [Clostridia bacterium]